LLMSLSRENINLYQYLFREDDYIN
jgi:hypothetical protein